MFEDGAELCDHRSGTLAEDLLIEKMTEFAIDHLERVIGRYSAKREDGIPIEASSDPLRFGAETREFITRFLAGLIRLESKRANRGKRVESGLLKKMEVERAERFLKDEIGEGAELGEERSFDPKAHQPMKLPDIFEAEVADENHGAPGAAIGLEDARMNGLERRLVHAPKRREEFSERGARDGIILLTHENSAFFSSSSDSTSIHVSWSTSSSTCFL